MYLMHGGIKRKLSFVSLISCLAIIRCYAFYFGNAFYYVTSMVMKFVQDANLPLSKIDTYMYIRNRMMRAAFLLIVNRCKFS